MLRNFLSQVPLVTLAAGCGLEFATVAEPAPSERIEVDVEASEVTIAAIGDYGRAGPDEAAVAELVRSWHPDFVITMGDNNYDRGEAETIDENVGRYYRDFIHPYRGRYDTGGTENRFFPALGNHDWRTSDLEPYLEYFTLPGNERYYDVRWGPVHAFAIDSDDEEPDGRDSDSIQARWLRGALAQSDAPWKLVYLHHAPYSSSEHGSTEVLQWPFATWGANAVLAGHDHIYERIGRDGISYFVNGLGGHPNTYEIDSPVAGSRVRFNQSHGAMRIHATESRIVFEFVTVEGKVVDRVELETAHAWPD